MFEVGKKYKHEDSGRVIEALFAYDNGLKVIGKTIDPGSIDCRIGAEFPDYWGCWKEYVEPKVEESYSIIFKGAKGSVVDWSEEDYSCLTEAKADEKAYEDKAIGYVKLTVTNGKLTGAEVVA